MSPEVRAGRSSRRHSLAVSGSFTTEWTAGLGEPGAAGCFFVRESGADRATFTAGAFEPAAGGGLRGRIDRTHTLSAPCVPNFGARAPSCPQRGPLGGSVLGSILPDGGLTADGRRVRGTRVALGLQFELGGAFCTGWAGLLPSATLDAPAGAVRRLRVGGRTTVRLTRRLDCRDAVIESLGEPTACAVHVAATVVVRRIR